MVHKHQVEQETLFDHMFAHSLIGAALMDISGGWLRSNTEFNRIIGYSEHELRNLTLSAITFFEHHDQELDLLKTLTDGSRESYQMAKRFIHSFGHLVCAEVKATFLRSNQNDPPCILYQIKETNDHYLLQASEQRYKSLFEYHPDLIYSMDLEGNYTSVNASFEHKLGYSKEQIVRQNINFRELVHPDTLSCTEIHFEQATKGVSQRYEAAALDVEGNLATFDVTNVPIILDNQIVGVYGIARDITEQQHLLQELQESQEMYQLISDHAQDIITSSGPDGIIQYVSPAVEWLLGYTPEEFIGTMATDYYHPDDLAAMLQAGVLKETDTDIITSRVRHKEGHYVWFETTVKIIRNDCGDIFKIIAVGREITKRMQMELVLQESEERYRGLVETSLDAIVLTDGERCLFINDAGIKMFGGTDQQQFIGRKIFDLLHPNYHEIATERIRKVLQEKKTTGLNESEWFTLDGKLFVAEVVGLPSVIHNKPALQIILRDISGRKLTEELIRQSEKLTLAGQLAAGIAHEIRNPLTAIKGFVQLMQGGYGDSQKYFGIIMAELNRIELILSELLVLAKPQAVNYRTVHLQHLLQQVIALLGTQAIMNSIQITAEMGSEDIYIFCDENQMKQVFINLLKNATEVMPSGGEIIIDARRREQRVVIDVIDQGLGIPEEQLSKLGMPFYSTKENGTGLGLLISYNIIGNHKGCIKVKSTIGVGTTFSIDLPLYNDSKDGHS